MKTLCYDAGMAQWVLRVAHSSLRDTRQASSVGGSQLCLFPGIAQSRGSLAQGGTPSPRAASDPTVEDSESWLSISMQTTSDGCSASELPKAPCEDSVQLYPGSSSECWA